MAKDVPLTREEALQMQDTLLFEYSKPEFQAKLRKVLEDDCTKAEKLELEKELRELREHVGLRFGFEASPAGVEQSIKLFTSELRADAKIASKCRQMEILLHPQLQDELNGLTCGDTALGKKVHGDPRWKAAHLSIKRRAELNAKHEAEDTMRKRVFSERRPADGRPIFMEKIGRHWLVVGGGSKHGIVVRRKEYLLSPAMSSRLAKGAEVEELELVGDRLHYRKINGEGPDFGWVSIYVKGATLLEAIDNPLEDQEDSQDDFETEIVRTPPRQLHEDTKTEVLRVTIRSGCKPPMMKLIPNTDSQE